LKDKLVTMKQFDNETITNLYVFCDGGARGNPGPAAIGFLIKDNKGKVLIEKGKFIGRATNNVAEYRAVIEALKWIFENQANFQFPISNFQFFLDSKLVVNQLNGLYKIKDAKLRNLIIQARGLESQIKASIIYYHIPREKNQAADKLLNQALDRYLLKASRMNSVFSKISPPPR